jgi:hypothetical protein
LLGEGERVDLKEEAPKLRRDPNQTQFTFDDTDKDKARSGKPSKDSSLWKTLFSKDV